MGAEAGMPDTAATAEAPSLVWSARRRSICRPAARFRQRRLPLAIAFAGRRRTGSGSCPRRKAWRRFNPEAIARGFASPSAPPPRLPLNLLIQQATPCGALDECATVESARSCARHPSAPPPPPPPPAMRPSRVYCANRCRPAHSTSSRQCAEPYGGAKGRRGDQTSQNFLRCWWAMTACRLSAPASAAPSACGNAASVMYSWPSLSMLGPSPSGHGPGQT